jgi:hypothetical protein
LHKLLPMNKSFFALYVLVSLVLFNGCKSNKPAPETDEFTDTVGTVKDSATQKAEERLDFKFFYTIANLPSPMEMINAIYNYKVPFNKDLLNPPSKASDYSSGFKKAVNYGIYGIDMAYAAFYGQNQDLLDYYSTTKKMAEKLNVQETFDKFTSSFMDNEQNRDSLVKIIDRAYSETDNYLRSNRRIEVASHVLAGSVIEVEYLSVELLKNEEKNKSNAEIFEKVYNGKLYFDNLISLFSDLQKYPSSSALLAQLKTIKAVFDEITSPESLDKAALIKLSAVIAPVRNDLIK